MILDFILLQASGGGGIWSTVIFMVAIFAVFYLFMIYPQQKQRKDERKFQEALKKGDQVVTMSGIHGKVHNLDNNTITLEVDKGTKIVFEKSTISMTASKQKSEAKK